MVRSRVLAAAVSPRPQAMAWAAAVVADERTVYLDTETTGLHGGAEVVDIAVIGADGRILLETLVRPVDPIPPIASGIHGIFDRHVATAPTWVEVHRELCQLVRGRRVVIYNAAFDRRIINQCCQRHELDEPCVDRWDCAMVAYAEFLGGTRWRQLGVAAAAFGLAAGGHRAAADAMVCRGVVTGMASAEPISR